MADDHLGEGFPFFFSFLCVLSFMVFGRSIALRSLLSAASIASGGHRVCGVVVFSVNFDRRGHCCCCYSHVMGGGGA